MFLLSDGSNDYEYNCNVIRRADSSNLYNVIRRVDSSNLYIVVFSFFLL